MCTGRCGLISPSSFSVCGAERAELLAGHIPADVVAVAEERHAGRQGHQRQEPQGEVDRQQRYPPLDSRQAPDEGNRQQPRQTQRGDDLHRPRGLGPVGGQCQADHRRGETGRQGQTEIKDREPGHVAPADPVAAADQHQAQVKQHGGHGHEVNHPPETEDPAAEVAELVDQAPLGNPRSPLAAEDHVGIGQKDQGDVEDHAQHVGHGEVRREERGRHSHGEHRQADQPVTGVGAQEQAGVRVAQRGQHDVVAGQGEAQGHRVDRHRGQVLADDHVQVAGRHGQQQLVGALLALLRPDAHADRRDEEQHD